MASFRDEPGVKCLRLSKLDQPQRKRLTHFAFLSLLVFSASLVNAASTLTLQTNKLGPTPDILAYNCGHFVPGSNTRDWWRYSGTTGARLFITASIIEPSDDIAGRGDGVTNQTSFVSRKAAL